MLGAAGIGSGLDVNSLVEQLMEVEKRSLTNLNNQEKKYNTQLSSYGVLKNAMHEFKDTMESLCNEEKFEIYSTTTSDEKIISAVADKTATSGNYTITVNQLAQAHKIASRNFSDTETSIGASGTLELDINGDKFTLDIDESNDTLAGIKDSINNALDNVGVKASIINIDDGLGGTASRLVLTSDQMGSTGAITLTDISGDVAETLNVSTELMAAQDANIDLNGFSVTCSSNIIDDAIEGVTLTLQSVSAEPIELTINRDDQAITDSVQKFLDTYNTLIDSIAREGSDALKKDSSLKYLKSELRNIINEPAENIGNFSYLQDIGVSIDKKTGKLSLDASEFKTALSQDFGSFVKLFSSTDEGFATRLHNFAESQDDDSGIIKTRSDGLQRRIDFIEKGIERENMRLDKVESGYYKRFSMLDSLMSQLDATTDYLNQQLSNLPGVKSSKKQ